MPVLGPLTVAVDVCKSISHHERKPWLKPFFVGICRGLIFQGLLGFAGFRPSTVCEAVLAHNVCKYSPLTWSLTLRRQKPNKRAIDSSWPAVNGPNTHWAMFGCNGAPSPRCHGTWSCQGQLYPRYCKGGGYQAKTLLRVLFIVMPLTSLYAS